MEDLLKALEGGEGHLCVETQSGTLDVFQQQGPGPGEVTWNKT